MEATECGFMSGSWVRSEHSCVIKITVMAGEGKKDCWVFFHYKSYWKIKSNNTKAREDLRAPTYRLIHKKQVLAR